MITRALCWIVSAMCLYAAYLFFSDFDPAQGKTWVGLIIGVIDLMAAAQWFGWGLSSRNSWE